MKARVRSLASLMAVVTAIIGVGGTIDGPLRAIQAQDTGGPIKPRSADYAKLQRHLTNNLPTGVAALVTTVNKTGKSNGVRYNAFVSDAIFEALNSGTVPNPANLPALTATNSADVANALTEDQIRAIVVAKVRSQLGATLPKDLKERIGRRNAMAKQLPRARQAAAGVGVGLAPLTPAMTKLDYRDPSLVVPGSGIVTVAKNQAGCGCCWAFATIAAVEASYARNNSLLINASEQYVLNNSGFLANAEFAYTCGGGWWAFDLLLDAKAPPPAGVAREIDLPYNLSNPGPGVNGPLALPYKLSNWGYITPINPADPQGIQPTVNDLKKALCDYGPIAVAVNVPTDSNDVAIPLWGMNSGSPLGDFPNDSSKGISHVVLLIGWDDSIGTAGSWIFKNSWGPGWGMPDAAGVRDTGCGYINYNMNNFGIGAAWVEAAP